jgi:hypothetical protein
VGDGENTRELQVGAVSACLLRLLRRQTDSRSFL